MALSPQLHHLQTLKKTHQGNILKGWLSLLLNYAKNNNELELKNHVESKKLNSWFTRPQQLRLDPQVTSAVHVLSHCNQYTLVYNYLNYLKSLYLKFYQWLYYQHLGPCMACLYDKPGQQLLLVTQDWHWWQTCDNNSAHGTQALKTTSTVYSTSLRNKLVSFGGATPIW